MSEEGVIWLRAIFSCVMPLWGRYFFMNDRRDGEAYPYGRFAMWYVLQTTTGQEEKLVQMIQELVAPELYEDCFATVYKGNIIKNLIMDCQSYTKYRPNETTGGIFVSWRRKEELPTGA